MKRLLVVVLGFVALVAALLVGCYFLFPETLFRIALNGERRFAGLVKKEVRVDDHNIVYLEGGKGPTILMIHGFGGNKDNWTRIARHLSGEYHLVIPDLPGFGESSQIPTETYDAENQLKRIDRFAETLKLEKFHLAGNSMGGMFSAMYGATYPRKVITLALLAPGGVGSPNPSEAAILIKGGKNPLLTGTYEDFDRLLNLCFVNPPPLPSRFKGVLAAEAVAHSTFNKKVWVDLKFNRIREDLASIENILVPFLARIEAPTLILWGDGDKILDVGGVAVLEKHLKTSRTVIMKETGHIPMLEKPKETASHYAGFLKGIP